MVDFHPKPQTRPATVRQAFEGVPDDGTGNRISPTSKTWRAMKSVKPGQTHAQHFSLHRLSLDEPAPTIQKGDGAGHYHVWHPAEHRLITLAECKRLASFPDAFQFTGSIREAWSRIGNCVPPRFMCAIAEHAYETFLAPSRQGAGHD